MSAASTTARTAVALGLPRPGGARPRTPARASDLPIAGITPLSTVDWPGKLVATVFVQGCPWRCTYCHNTEILDCTTPGTRSFDELMALLAKRRGLLDGVVFSGGEATRTRALGPAIEAVKSLGFAVGLHTAGSYNLTLTCALAHLDWVGFDVKGLPEQYPAVAGVGAALGERSWASLQTVLDSGVATEVRLTTYPGAHGYDAIVAIGMRVFAMGATSFALQQARGEGGRGIFTATAQPTAAQLSEFDRAAATLTARFGAQVIVRK